MVHAELRLADGGCDRGLFGPCDHDRALDHEEQGAPRSEDGADGVQRHTDRGERLHRLGNVGARMDGAGLQLE